MGTGTRRRLGEEGGLSLVEMMIALMIFTVAVFALLGSLIASARSVVDQQLRADATRVATQRLEATRSADYDDLAIGTETETVTTSNGGEMDVERVVAWMDAWDPASGSGEDVKVVTVTVSWSDRGRDREVVYTTAVAPDDPEFVGPATVVVTPVPPSVVVDDDGVPATPVTLEASPEGFTHVGDMTARWTRYDGTLATLTLSQVPATEVWQGTMSQADLTWPMDPGDTVEVPVTVVAGGREGQTVVTLQRPADASAPTLSAPSVSPDPILLSNPPGNSNNCGTNYCKNVDPVTFSVVVTPGSPTQTIERVYVEYDLREATGPTAQDLTVGLDGLTWSYTAPANSVQFATGTAQAFSFFAVYDTDQVTLPTVVQVEVRRQ